MFALQLHQPPPIFVPSGMERCHLCEGRGAVVIAPNDMVYVHENGVSRQLPTIPGKIEECGVCDGRGFHEEYPPLPDDYESDWLS